MLNYDLKPSRKKIFRTRRKLPITKFHLYLLGGTLMLTGMLMALSSNDAEAIKQPVEQVAHSELPLPPATTELILPAQLPETVEPEPAPLNTRMESVTVRSGDTLAKIFNRQGLTPRDVYDVVSSGPEAEALKRIKPGESIDFTLSDDSKLLELAYKTDITHTLKITKTEDGYAAAEEVREPEVRLTHTSGMIESSLFIAGQKAGLTDNMIMELANIFGWDIDFALDIRQDDSFTVLYEEEYLDGEKIGYGSIVAAHFSNQGREFQAIRYTDPTGGSAYYTPEGNSMRKAFLRSPVDFRRISSKFQPERYHPVLGKKRPHRGVDYAAATGTPIRSAGDGKIIFRGTKGGYGSTVIVQHGTQYTTLYAHLSNFKRGQRNGNYVKQGDVIGFVGQSGLATGPHLHYEFRVNGVHRNPLTVKFPDAEPIKDEYRADFVSKTRPILAQLHLLNRTTTVARNDF